MSESRTSKELALDGIKELVEKFENNYKQFHASDYNETLTRQDFINPFFEYLGWDVSNKQGYSQVYREVIHEDKLKIGKETKSPDYSFRIGGNRVFFVEAKKPSLNLKEDSDAAYQIRRYAWSGKLAVSILTDFEEFAIYDCSKKPSPNDKASMSRIEYINYKDYLNRFDFLYDTFAKENVLKGSLEKYNADTKNKKGTESVDIDFLNSLDNLRTKLASSISKLNGISERDLNFAVQHIIDRIIFLRVAEDRGVENYGDLREACNNNNGLKPIVDNSYYQNIVEIFKKSDGKYNSGIFDFSKDKITDKIKVDNKVIKEIINDLYYPKSPYEFSVISVEIIGNAYEQFLGKTITIGANHAKSGQTPRAKIEFKPEVRKAGGVYYTPEYIVDYIVENTVGEKIKNKKPDEIAKIKIVDPACGSGSFLLGAYKYLLNYHREYYSKQGKKKFLGSKEDAMTEDGELALWVKKQILINNIFGVDIDSNAVEVTKLSLLLKCMEGETPASIMNNQSLFNERALPSLDENIKCGNSLIGNDFYSYNNNMFKPVVNEKSNNRQERNGNTRNMEIARKGLKPLVIKNQTNTLNLFDEKMQYKINCFDWEREFPNIFSRKKKEVKAYHITFAIHNSRVSERMITYKVSKGEVLNLSEEDELFITKSIGEVIMKNDIKCLAYNISRDHVHILLVCAYKELTEIVRKIKGYSSYSFREYLNIPKGEEFHLWAQKYDAKEIDSDKRLYNTIEYINNNRVKHELPENKWLKPLALSFLCGQNREINNNTKAYKGLSQRDAYGEPLVIKDINDNHADNNEALAHCVKISEERNNAEGHKEQAHNRNARKGLSQRDAYGDPLVIKDGNDNYTDNNVALAHCMKNTEEHNNTIRHNTKAEHKEQTQTDNMINTHDTETAHKGQAHNMEAARKGLKPLVIRFEDAFNEAFNQYEEGGFDIVIGNPPYVSIRTVDFNNEYKDYFENKYNLALGQYDLYSLFTELSYNILNQNGIYGFILPKRLSTNENFQSLRDFYINKFNIIEYVDAGKPFLGASVEANIIIASKLKSNDYVKVGIFNNSEYNHFQNMDKKFIDSMPFQIFPFLVKNDNLKLLDKIKLSDYSNLGLHCDIIRGFECGFNNPKIDKKKSKYKIIRGENIHRYIVEWGDYYVHPDFKNEAKIFKREEIFTKTPKLLTKFVSNNIEFALDEVGYCNTNVVYNVHIKDNTNIKYLLGLLNSKVVNFWFKNIYVNDDTLFPHIQKNQLASIPIPIIDLTKKSDKEIHDKLVNLVDNMIEINKKLHSEKNPDVVTMLRRQVEAIDGEIDRLVYGLYGLSEEEIKIVENN